MKRQALFRASLLVLFLLTGTDVFAKNRFRAGAAKIDITPQAPIRLSGYAVRKTPSQGVAQPLYAQALALADEETGLAILITVDSVGVPAGVTEKVAAALRAKLNLPRERFIVSSSHTHTGPCLSGALSNLFVAPVPPEQQIVIDRYTDRLTQQMIEVALEASQRLQPAELSWGTGAVQFAANRRTRGGPVDHSLPVLRIVTENGALLAVLANYACHCTTLGGDFNQVCGDWAGFAKVDLEAQFQGATAFITIGCGADANPAPLGSLELAKQHGRELAVEAGRVVNGGYSFLDQPLECVFRQIDLAFEKPFTREQWEERAKKPGIVGYHARQNLARLDRGEQLPTHLPYPVQVWRFGDELAMVFLGGEVVVDYALRLKNEFDPARLWVTAYANDVPCYIPSKRILTEGGYEAEDSLWYYDRPNRLRPETEDLIIRTVHELLPASFVFDAHKAEFPPPKNLRDALASIRAKPGLVVELAAAEPEIVDPVAIDFGPDGKLWVVEMCDYPAGLDGNYKPGGRVKFLEDLDGDGRYEKSTLFLDGLPFPTDVMAWRRGALICAAPDILYAQDTNGDGKADVVKKLFTGFPTHNFQARVNGLTLGLDNWVYGSSSLFGGTIESLLTGKSTKLSGRDFRLKPDTGEFEPAAGLSQQSRVRDDWDNWFGCDNSNLIWHFPLPEAYVRRNPYVTGADPKVNLVAIRPEAAVTEPQLRDPNRVFPISRTLRRFNDPGSANRVTSVCGLAVYRDDLFGPGFYENAFACEPVHNLVHRLQLIPQGVTFAAVRAPDEAESEFLASTDNWFRPVQVEPGPDGALYIVDMYRFVIEHPRWITPDRLAQLDVRAGSDKGRIYRVYPRGKKLRRIESLTRAPAAELAARLDSSAAAERDRIHRELFERQDATAREPLVRAYRNSQHPPARAQALWLLNGIRALPAELVEEALTDSDPGVRRQAIRLTETIAESTPHLRAALLQLINDPDPGVRFQLALTLGNWNDARAGEALAKLISDDRWQQAAVISSAGPFAVAILHEAASSPSENRVGFIADLVATAANSGRQNFKEAAEIILPKTGQLIERWRWMAAAPLWQALERQGRSLDQLKASALESNIAERLEQLWRSAQQVAGDQNAPESDRLAALNLAAQAARVAHLEKDFFRKLLREPNPNLQRAAVAALNRSAQPDAPAALIADWPQFPPSLRSQVLDTLLSREAWSKELLGAVETSRIHTGELSAAVRDRLRQSGNAEIKQRSEKLFSATDARTEIVKKFSSALGLPSNARHGEEVFQKNCATCHQFRGQGHEVGPNLAALTDKSGPSLLMSILDPNAAVDERFKNYTVELKDGRELSGLITAETSSSLTLVRANGERDQILLADVAAIRGLELSLMPEGFEQLLTPQDLADLLAYVQGR